MVNNEEIPAFGFLVEKVPTPLPKTVAIGADRARAVMIHLVKNEKVKGKVKDFGPGILSHLHRLILFYIPKWAGQLRLDDDTKIAGKKVIRADELPDKVYCFERWLERETKELRSHPEDLDRSLRVAAAAHFGITSELHPFNDGNGRVARILLNGILLITNKECLAHNICVLPVPVLREEVNEREIRKLLEAGKEPKLDSYLQTLEDVGKSWDLTPLKLHLASKWEKSLGSFLMALHMRYARFHKKNWHDNLNLIEWQIVEDMERRRKWLEDFAATSHSKDPVPDYFSASLLNKHYQI
ncbi:hypothetical protein A2617_04490 [Candidatus Daviesbacteria bacterium RIFOXYD1_FULL_41_10]|uniref:Fido domain-containing protein n=1 Tax=Candidatus Daviesbacteria bacterium RIFOXYD1_FULL_41_10 TaxID=1797801 RepID=A0A1F5N005_9BACT|nr:MAG: hypothetical protein A2617_04490 [Candidatus Daviesbacteria bacterium RIFOXYD1_FULL_41_10]